MGIRRKRSEADEYMINYFTSFRLLTHYGVNNIRVKGVLNKSRLRKCTVIGEHGHQNMGFVDRMDQNSSNYMLDM